MNSFGLFTNSDSVPAHTVRDRVADFLSSRGCISFDEASTEHSADCIIAIGGDGTILRGAAAAAVEGCPILGINLGRIGFLSEVDMDGAEAAIDAVLAGHYDVEHRLMLKCRVNGRGEFHCLNDFLVYKRSFSGVAQMEILVDGMSTGGVFCDGITVSTPTGSTGYSISAGGPVVAPGIDAATITPICSHTLHIRPIVASADSHVELRLFSEGFLAADGMQICRLDCGDLVSITRSEREARFIRFGPSNLFELIREKLI